MDALFGPKGNGGDPVSLDEASISRQGGKIDEEYYGELYKDLLSIFQEGYATSKQLEQLAEMHRIGLGTVQDEGLSDFFEEKSKQYKKQEDVKRQEILDGVRSL